MNRQFPEATVIETYRLYEMAHYISLSTDLPPDAFNLPSQQDEILPSTGHEVTSTSSSDYMHRAFAQDYFILG